MCKLLIFDSFDNADIPEFLDIYKESSRHNSVLWYPDLSEAEALCKYESGYTEYMKNDFFTKERKLIILSDGKRYLSALRLSEISADRFYIEALETNPAFRRKGYAKKLMLLTEEYLKKRRGKFTVISNVEKNNAASLNTHFAAGFKITADYYIEDGKRYDTDYELTYNSK